MVSVNLMQIQTNIYQTAGIQNTVARASGLATRSAIVLSATTRFVSVTARSLYHEMFIEALPETNYGLTG